MIRAGARAVRSAILLALGLLPAWGCGPEAEAPADAAAARTQPPPRSVVLVTIDTLRADVLGAYGSTLGASPLLDRLAAEGVLFEQAHASSPSTFPSHSSILTGRRPFRHGVRSNFNAPLADEWVTLAERLAEQGFVTGAEVAAVVLGRHTAIDQGFQHFRDTESADVVLPELPPEVAGELAPALRTRPADDITSRGIEFLERHAGEPFLLWLHYYDPHWPYTPPEPWGRRFRARVEGMEEPAGPLVEKSPIREHRYAGEVAFVDAQLERLVSSLRGLGLADHTLLAITSDHGEALGEHGEDTHSYYVYQSTMHVPLLLWGPPELPRGARVSQPVRSLDVAPTLLDWLGAPALEAADGTSLLPLVREPAAGGDRIVYGESIELKRLFGSPVLRFLRDGRWKYVHKPRPALFDLSSEPDEQHDLAESRPEERDRLRDRLRELLDAADPAAAPGDTAELDPERTAQLEALGYVVGEGPTPVGDELEDLEAGGPDPDDLFQELRLVTWARPESGDPEEHLGDLRDLAARFPESPPVLAKLLEAQLAAGLGDAALETLRRGVRVAPQEERFWSNYAELLVKLGRAEEARRALPEALEHFPCHHTTRTNLANYRAQDGDHAARIALLESGLAECEPVPELQNELAYALATVPDPALRDGERALELARHAVEGLGDNPLVLDTLAVAQAEVGRRDEARSTLSRAVQLARAQRLPPAALEILNRHAELVAAGEPIAE